MALQKAWPDGPPLGQVMMPQWLSEWSLRRERCCGDGVIGAGRAWMVVMMVVKIVREREEKCMVKGGDDGRLGQRSLV